MQNLPKIHSRACTDCELDSHDALLENSLSVGKFTMEPYRPTRATSSYPLAGDPV